ncbi:MAG TPA: DoxX family membrane protein [Pseudonocardiaceae bacterium]
MPIRRIARSLLAATFIANGVDTLLHPKSKVEAARPVLDKARTLVPAAASVDPELFVKADGAVKVGAGLMMALGRAPRLSAALLAVDLIPSTATEHPFWSGDYADDRRTQQAQFLKNASLFGGLILAITAPSSKKSKLSDKTEQARKKGERVSRRARKAAENARKDARKAAKNTRKEVRKAAENTRRGVHRAARHVGA